MPISNLKYRLRVKDKYKPMFPLEDPTPYWEEIDSILQTKHNLIKKSQDPYDHLKFLIEALKHSISFLEEYVPHTPADSKPAFYAFNFDHYYRMEPICPDYLYFLAEEQLCLKNKGGAWTDLNFQKKMLARLDSILNNTYTPLSDFEKESIKRRYYEFNKGYDPKCFSYHKWFS